MIPPRYCTRWRRESACFINGQHFEKRCVMTSSPPPMDNSGNAVLDIAPQTLEHRVYLSSSSVCLRTMILKLPYKTYSVDSSTLNAKLQIETPFLDGLNQSNSYHLVLLSCDITTYNLLSYVSISKHYSNESIIFQNNELSLNI